MTRTKMHAAHCSRCASRRETDCGEHCAFPCRVEAHLCDDGQALQDRERTLTKLSRLQDMGCMIQLMLAALIAIELWRLVK